MTASPSLGQRFDELDRKRANKIQRAREWASLVLPPLFSDEGSHGEDDLFYTFSSFAGRGATRLAAKLTNSTIPPNRIKFFEIDLSHLVEVSDEEVANFRSQVARLELAIMEEIWASNVREVLYRMYQHLVVIGDGMMDQDDDFVFGFTRVDDYVTVRNGKDKVVEIILREWVNSDRLPPEWESIPKSQTSSVDAGRMRDGQEPVFTQFLLDDETKKWKVLKQFRGRNVSRPNDSYDVLPYFVARWATRDKDNYGRSLVEENAGDIRSLEGMTEALIQGIATNSWGMTMVDPTGLTQIRDVEEAKNWDTIPGRAADITFAQPNAVAQIQITSNAVQDLQASLREVFLMNVASQLTGERVTATQVLAAAQELEQATGGLFSSITREIQEPIVRRAIAVLVKKNKLDPDLVELINDGTLKINIKTGLDALGRQIEAGRLFGVIDRLKDNPEAMSVFDMTEVARFLVEAEGIDPRGLVKSRERQAQEASEAQQQALQQQVGEQTIKTVGAIAEKSAVASP